MKLKMIAAALAVGLSAQAHAGIADGHADGNGELFLNVWDVNGSYTLDLGVRINAFESALADGGALNLSWAADATFNNYLSSVADVSALRFNVVAGDNFTARRLLSTYTTTPMIGRPAGDIRAATATVRDFANYVDAAAGNLVDADNVSVVVDSANAAYAGKSSFGPNVGGLIGMDNSGSFVNANSAATGLGFLRINANQLGSTAATYNPYTDGGAVKVWFDAQNGLHIAAVPEPEAYAMFLAGLGMIGAMVRRRRNAV